MSASTDFRIGFWSLFVDRSVEARFRDHNERQEILQTSLLVIAGVAAAIFGAFGDYRLFGTAPTFYHLLYGRGALIVYSAIVWVAIRRNLKPSSRDMLVLLWLAIGSTLQFSTGTTRTTLVFMGFGYTSMFSLFFLYFLAAIPADLLAMFALLSVACTYLQGGFHPDLDVQVRRSMLAANLFTNILGVLATRSFHRARREQFAAIEQLRSTEAALREATQAKSQFLANMSHEIRTPMNAVIAVSELLGRGHLTGQQRSFVDTIRRSGESLLRVINDILDFSKIEAGKLDLEQQPLDLWQCIEESCTLLAPNVAKKRLELVCRIASDVPQEIVGDVVRLRQALLNLLGNAIKFTLHGSVLLDVTTCTEHDKPAIQFAVKDTGIGMTPAQQATLFKSFSQADVSNTRRFGGTGLGLAISKNLAEMMGGRMWVESVPDRGSTFQFTIVAASTGAAPAAYRHASPPELAGKTLTIDGGGALNRDLVASTARSWGMRIVPAGPADITLAVRTIDGAASGVVVYEPVRVSQLYEVLLDSVGRRSTAGAAPVARAARSTLRILLADDNEVNQQVGIWVLDEAGYHADVASNGRQVIDALQRRRYDVVLMDVQMPEMDGWEATREIRRLWPADGPCIIAMTASAFESDREKCIAAGMDDFVTKPIRMEELVSALERAAGISKASSAAR